VATAEHWGMANLACRGPALGYLGWFVRRHSVYVSSQTLGMVTFSLPIRINEAGQVEEFFRGRWVSPMVRQAFESLHRGPLDARLKSAETLVYGDLQVCASCGP
jgi:hypothetical protein